MERTRLEVLTPRGGLGGITVVRVRGAARFDHLARFLVTPAGRAVTPAQLAGAGPRLLNWQVGGETVDQLLFVDRPAVAWSELHFHGSPAVLDAVRLVTEVVPVAAPVAAQERLLRMARVPAQLALALEQRALGPFSTALQRLERGHGSGVAAAVRAALQRSVVAMALANPATVALVGQQNAGKSTLFNRLLLESRALAGPMPGLTRDPISEPVILGDYPYVLIDTAGEGEARTAVDRRAIERARSHAARADLRLLVIDRAAPPVRGRPGFSDVDVIPVLSHRDRPPHPELPDEWRTAPGFDLRDPSDAPEVRAVIGRALATARRLPAAPARGVGGLTALDAEQLRLLRAAAERVGA